MYQRANVFQLLFLFISLVRRWGSVVYANVQYAVYTQNYASLSASAGASASAKTNAVGANKRLELSPQLLQLAQMLDRLAIMGCLVFGELPAHNKVRFRFVVTKMFFSCGAVQFWGLVIVVLRVDGVGL
jgi:hypothetical protein